MSDVKEKKILSAGKKNDKRNSICGNVMLLSQSRGEISLSAFAKKN